MYSSRAIRAAVKKLESAYQLSLREYSVQECAAMEARLLDAIDEHHHARRPLDTGEQQFIQNELLMCKVSFRYMAARYFRIRNKDGLVQRLFPFLGSQDFVLQRLGEFESEPDRIDGLLINVLKATRQVGMSVLAQALHVHRAVTQDNVTTLVASDTHDRSALLFNIAEMMVDELPWFLRPKVTDRVKNQELRFEGGSALLVHSGKSMKGQEGKRGQIGRGMAQPLSEPVLTPFGWKLMGELVIGDYVVGGNGRPTRIRAIYPRGVEPIFRVTFSDGTWTHCTEEHLWTVNTVWRKWAGSKWLTLSLRQLVLRGLYVSKRKFRKYHIPMTGPIEFPQRALPIKPYLLGVLLGDGSYRHSAVAISSADSEIVERCQRELPVGCSLKKKPRNQYDWSLTGTRQRNEVQVALASLKLRGLYSHEKFVPPDYLLGTSQERLALLQGLMDTDGTADGVFNRAAFSSTSRQLAEDVQWLAQSLGGVSKIRRRSPSRAGVIRGRVIQNRRDSYVVTVRLPNQFNPFSLPRKADKLRFAKAGPTRLLVEVVPVGKAETQCIAVDARDGLYLTRSCIVTHNTLLGVHLSEVSTFEDPDQLQGSLFPAIPRNLRSLAFFETTAQGRGTWFHKHWKDSRAGRTRFRSVYIPWYVQKEHTLPAPEWWSPAQQTLDHAKRIEATAEAMTGSSYSPTRDQLFWYETIRNEYESTDRLHDFLQEYGSIDDDECFQTGGRSVLSAKTLDHLQQFIRPPAVQLEVSALRGGQALQ